MGHCTGVAIKGAGGSNQDPPKIRYSPTPAVIIRAMQKKNPKTYAVSSIFLFTTAFGQSFYWKTVLHSLITVPHANSGLWVTMINWISNS